MPDGKSGHAYRHPTKAVMVRCTPEVYAWLMQQAKDQSRGIGPQAGILLQRLYTQALVDRAKVLAVETGDAHGHHE